MPGFTGGVADTTEDPNSVNATWVLSKGCCIYTFLERYCKSNTLVTTHVVSRVLQISVANLLTSNTAWSIPNFKRKMRDMDKTMSDPS